MMLCHFDKNYLIAGPNDPLGDITKWVSYDVTFNHNGEIINDDDTYQERNIVALGTLTSDCQNYKIFNGMREKMNDFIRMKNELSLVFDTCHCHQQHWK